MKKQIIAACSMLLITASLLAQKPAVVASDKKGWHKIGESTADFSKDHDEISVMVADRFASLKFKVTDAAIEIVDIDVIFEEGDSQNIKVGYAVKTPGSESNEIDLKGGSERNLHKIIYRYRSLPNRKDKKAHIEVWGKKTNTDKPAKKSEPGHEGHHH
jgi:hypothetical protein